VRTAVGDLPGIMGPTYGAIMGYLGQIGVYPSGMPFTAYYNMDMDDLDVAIGFPVPQEVPGRDDLQPDVMSPGKYATAMHFGPYETIDQTYNALAAWVEEKGYAATGVAYEFYLNDPGEVAPEEIQTEIAFPVASA
jgi:effector-binding domain-containing protein